MLNSPRQSLKPSIFGCELRGQLPIDGTNIFAYGWGDTAEANDNPSDAFGYYSGVTFDSYILNPKTKKIGVYIVSDGKQGICTTLEELDPSKSYCEFAKCTEGTTCCSPLGVCCYNDGAGCTAPISKIECDFLKGIHDSTKQTCIGYDCNSKYAHCCDQIKNECPGCVQCSDVSPGAICADGSEAISGSCATSECDDSKCEDKVNNCVYSGGELQDCQQVCESQAGYPVDNCNECCECEELEDDGSCKSFGVCCVIDKDTGVVDCVSEDGQRCECSEGDRKDNCDDCQTVIGLYSCQEEEGVWACRPDAAGVPYNTCVATCTAPATTYNCENNNCVAVGDGSGAYKTIGECESNCNPSGTIECCQCQLSPGGGTVSCCRTISIPDTESCTDYNQYYFECSDCASECGPGAINCFTSGPTSLVTGILLAAKAKAKVYPKIFNTVQINQTTLQFGLDLPQCDVCNVSGRKDLLHQQGLTCDTQAGPGLIIEYDLRNICVKDEVKVNIIKTSNYATIQIQVKSYETPENYITLYTDKVALSAQGTPILLDYNCDICEFNYDCDYNDGPASNYSFNPPLPSINIEGNPAFGNERTSFIPGTERYILSAIKNALIEENIWRNYIEGTPLRITSPGNQSIAERYLNDNIVSLTRILGSNSTDGKYVDVNSPYFQYYGATCDCEDAGGCLSGYEVNPGLIGIVGGQIITVTS